MFAKLSPIPSRRPCPQCGGPVHYAATLATLFTGWRKRICRACGYVDSARVKIVSTAPQ